KNTRDDGFFARMRDLGTMPIVWIAWFTYYATSVALIVVVAFLTIAHAMALSLALAWGQVAIPTAIVSRLSILKPWATFLAILLLWPIVNYILFSFLGSIIDNAFTQTRGVSDGMGSSVDIAILYTVYAIGHLLLIAAVVAAPFIAQSLIANGAIGGIVTPFATAGFAAAGAILSQARERAKLGGQALSAAAKPVGGQAASAGGPGGAGALSGSLARYANSNMALNIARHLTAGKRTPSSYTVPPPPPPASERPGGGGGAGAGSSQISRLTPASAAGGHARAPLAKSSSNNAARMAMAAGTYNQLSGGDAGTTNAAPASAPDSSSSQEQARRQARRGAVLDRLHKSGKVKLPSRGK
ncbi:hypothetical protein, partial [Alkalilimnicola ehrlichii]